jgi:hypothetical protein
MSKRSIVMLAVLVGMILGIAGMVQGFRSLNKWGMGQSGAVATPAGYILPTVTMPGSARVYDGIRYDDSETPQVLGVRLVRLRKYQSNYAVYHSGRFVVEAKSSK